MENRRHRGRVWIVFLAALFAAANLALSASCPYCGQVYGEPAPGDEARVYALRAEHEASCPARFRNSTPDGGATSSPDYADSYGAVTVYNQTSRPVAYQMQSQAGGEWVQVTVPPGLSHYHWHTLPAQFQIRIPNGTGGASNYNLGYNTITGRQPTWQDGRPFYISGESGRLSFRAGRASSSAKPKLTTATCSCRGTPCGCLWDSCGPNGARKCGCGGKADCDCIGKRCPKFANTVGCNGSVLCNADGKYHCNRHGCPDGRGGIVRDQAHSRRYAGTWGGPLKIGLTGTFNLRLVVNPEGTTVSESGGLANGTHHAIRKGEAVTWRSGMFNEIEWTLTPGPDGRSATVTVRSPLGLSDSATFQRQ